MDKDSSGFSKCWKELYKSPLLPVLKSVGIREEGRQGVRERRDEEAGGKGLKGVEERKRGKNGVREREGEEAGFKGRVGGRGRWLEWGDCDRRDGHCGVLHWPLTPAVCVCVYLPRLKCLFGQPGCVTG